MPSPSAHADAAPFFIGSQLAGALFMSSDIQAGWKSLVAGPVTGYPNHVSSGRLLETPFLLLHAGRLRGKTLFTG